MAGASTMYLVTELAILLDIAEVKLEYSLEDLLVMLFAALAMLLAIADP